MKRYQGNQRGADAAHGMTGRILAQENLRIETLPGLETAAFDTQNRVLYMPTMEADRVVYDLFLMHEVAHALYTPTEWAHGKNLNDIPASYLNVIEDIRIEKQVAKLYPGIRFFMDRGLEEINNMDFFGIKTLEEQGYDFNNGLLIDKVNMEWKVTEDFRPDLTYDDEQQALLDEALGVETWDDVVEIARKIALYDTKNPPQTTQSSACPQQGDGEGEAQDKRKKKRVKVDRETFDRMKKEAKEGEGGEGEADTIVYTDEPSTDDGDGEGEGEGESQNGTEDDKEGESKELPQDRVIGTEGSKEQSAEVEARQFNDADSDYIDIDLTSITDSNYRNKEQELVSKQKGSHIRVNEKMLDEAFKPCSQNASDYGISSDKIAAYKKGYGAFLRDNQDAINNMVQEFDRKKAAYELVGAFQRDTGEIDVLELPNYRFTDDIFSQETIIPEGQNHGLVILLDVSGSMTSAIGGVLYQVLLLMRFCDLKDIPYAVYTFTTAYNHTTNKQPKNFSNVELSADYLIEHVRSDLPKGAKEMAIYRLFESFCYHAGQDYLQGVHARGLAMGGTPLFEALLVMRFQVERLKKAWDSEVQNFCVLTDGDGSLSFSVNRPKIEGDKHDPYNDYYSSLQDSIVINHGLHDRIQISPVNGGVDAWGRIYEMFSDISRVIGFFVTNRQNEIQYVIQQNNSDRDLNYPLSSTEVEEVMKSFDNKSHAVFVPQGGKKFRGHDAYIFMNPYTFMNTSKKVDGRNSTEVLSNLKKAADGAGNKRALFRHLGEILS